MCRSHSIHEQDILMTQYVVREERDQMQGGNWGEGVGGGGGGAAVNAPVQKGKKIPSLCKFDNSLVWKTRRQLRESQGGFPGLPVPNGLKAL